MGIIGGLKAFLEALDGPGNGPVAPSPAVQTAPSGPSQLERLVVDVEQLRARLEGLLSSVKEEADRANRAAERARKFAESVHELVNGSGEEPNAPAYVQGRDVQAGPGGGVLPMHGSVESPPPPSPEAIRAAARRAIALGS